jgi:phosphopantetheine adenylyltransferase
MCNTFQKECKYINAYNKIIHQIQTIFIIFRPAKSINIDSSYVSLLVVYVQHPTM